MRRLLALTILAGCASHHVAPAVSASVAREPAWRELTSISPPKVGLRVGGTQQLVFRVLRNDSVFVCPTQVQWKTLNPEVAQIGATGKLVALRPGATTIQARCGSLTAGGRADVGP